MSHSSMKTTHGPWFARDNGHFWEVVVSPDEFARSVADVPVTARQSNEESEKIARLLAMAPDLLTERDRLKARNAELAAVLETIVRDADGRRISGNLILDENSPVIIAACAVLAEHKGETE